MERMEAALMHLTHCVNFWTPQKPKTWHGPSNRHEAHKSRQTNDKHRQKVERSPQSSALASTRRNEVGNRRRASTLQ